MSEKIKAQKEITKELVKEAYFTLEKGKLYQLEAVCELFISIIRGKESSNNSDVEHFLKKYEGLVVSMNKVDASQISGTLAVQYMEEISRVKGLIESEPKCAYYAPFLNWSSRVIDMVNSQIELRKMKQSLDEAKDNYKEAERTVKQLLSKKHNYEQRLKDDKDILPEREESKAGDGDYKIITNLDNINQNPHDQRTFPQNWIFQFDQF